MGLSVGVIAFSAAGFRPIAGRLGDRHGRKLIVASGAVLAAISIGAQVFISSISPLVLLRVVGGIGEALFFTGAATVVTDMAPEERRGEAVSLFSMSLYLGLALGPLAGEATLEALGFNAVWLGSAAIAFLSAIVALPLRDTRAIIEMEQGTSRFLNRKGLFPGIVLACSVWGFAGYSSFIPLYAREVGLSGSRFLFAMFSLVILVVRLVGAKLPDRFGARRTAIFSLVLSLLGLILMASWTSHFGLYSTTVLFALGQALAFPALMTMAVESTSASERSSVVGTFTAFIDIGFGLGPLSLGVVAESSGYRPVFLASGVVAAIGLALLLRRRDTNEIPVTGRR